jgi:hypothetical protein
MLDFKHFVILLFFLLFYVGDNYNYVESEYVYPAPFCS